ncbi:MAG: EAL domain-containing protein [Gammaproteobacteria bacterium]|nr:EAL domain-containing protein [Gammaproteobacteria bacterium]
MSKPIKTIHLLILDPSSNDAEQTINVLRNAGYAVRATQVLSDEELQAALDRQAWDLMLAKAHNKALSPADAFKLVQLTEKDIPFICLSQELDAELVNVGLALGMQDVIPDGDPQRLRLVVQRELNNLDERRRRRRAENLLTEAERRCNLLLDSSRDAIAYIHDGMHIYANKSYLDLFGYEMLDELECMPIMDMLAGKDHDKFKEFLRQHEATQGEDEFRFTGVKANGEQFEAYLSISVATYDGEDCTQVLIRTASDSRELEEKLRELSAKDPVTNLYNRRHFLEQLVVSVAEATAGRLHGNILFAEIDKFAALKDRFGITETDLLLKESADLLEAQAPKDSLLGRIGDDTFAFILPIANPAEAKAFAENLCALVREHLFELSGHTESITLSVGVCPLDTNSPDAEEVLTRAQTACIRARSRGGNSAKIHDPAVDSAASSANSQLAEKINDALENNSLSMMFQPIVRLHGEDAEFYDLTLRMRDDEGKAIPPDQFFPAAAQAGMAGKLDRWAITHGLKALAEKRQAGHPNTRLFLRLSAASLTDEHLLTFIGKTLQAHRLPVDAVIFTIHEHDAHSHLKRAIAFSERMNQLGGVICLTGLGASGHVQELLRHLNVPFLKLEGALAQELPSNKETQVKVKELLDAMHKLGKRTIIPSVEDASCLAVLWPLGAHYIQGYYLSGPAPSMSYDFGLAEF